MFNWINNRLQINGGKTKPSQPTSPFKFNRFGSTQKLPHGTSDSANSPTAAMINLPASLEDCYTNVLALTELSGLKWRRLTTADNYHYGTDLDQDPILSAYSRCVRENVLCTWRRRQRQNDSTAQIDNVALRLDIPKELWIFWYSNDEPELVKILEKENGLITPDDTEFPDLTIKYETRTQFFKALHNVFERNMLKNGYVRFGRWFTRPLDDFAVSPDCAMPSYINGLRFEFAVQGENHVCATIKNQCQPPILRLSTKHLQSITKPMPVILAPWSIRAQLLPQQPLRELQNSDQLSSSLNSSGFSLLASSVQQQTQLPEEIQAAVEEQWNQWSAMLSMASLPTADEQNEQNENVAPSTSSRQPTEKLPRFVAVEVDGTRMFYPTCFIGVLPQELSEHGNKLDQRGLMSDDLDLNDSLVGFSQASQIDLLEIRRQKMLAAKKKETFVPETLRHSRKSNVGVRIARRSFEDAALAAPPAPLPAPAPPTLQRMKTETGLHLNMPSTSVSAVSANASDDLRWNYFDYLRKEYCYCQMCSSGGGNQPESKSDVDSKTSKQTNQPSTSSAPYVFHRSVFNDRLGGYGTDPNLFSPPQNPQKVASPEQTQKELDFLRQLDEKERQHSDHSEPKVPIFARTIATTQRTAIPSDRLNFASVQECNFNNLFKRHLNAIGFPKEQQQQDLSAEFEPFTPITCVTPDPEATQDFNNPENRWPERIRNFNYPYHPQKTDYLVLEKYHVENQRDKPVGPRLKPPSETVRELPVHLTAAPTQASTSSSILKSLLDAPDDEDESSSCLQAMQKRSTSPRSMQKEDKEWQKCIGEALQQRRRTPSQKWMSEREKELRRRYSQQQLRRQRQTSIGEELVQPKWQSQTTLHERSKSIGELNSDNVHSALRERLLSPSMSINLSVRSIEEPMELDQLHSNSNQLPSRLQSSMQAPVLQPKRSSTNRMFDPLNEGEESQWVYKGPADSLLYGQQVKERYLMCENVKPVVKPYFLKSAQVQKEPVKTDNEYPVLRRMIQEDLVEVEDPKTPISNLNASIASHLGHQAPHSQQDLQQMFTSAHSNDVHSILSPPASNEQLDSNPLALQQQHTPGDKSQPQQAQSLVSVGQSNSLMLHSSGWNTTAVSANNIHDSLNIIYPTPPTPLQQFSPLNANPILAEDPQAKRRRLAEGDEYSEAEQDEENEANEQNDGQASKKLNKFLSVENLAADLLKMKAPTLPVYTPKKLELPPYSELFVGDLLDEEIEPKKKLRWLKHLKRESVGRRQKLKEDLKKRSARKEIALPPEYVCQFKGRRLMMPSCALTAFNPNDKHRLAKNAIELAAVRRKPINSYGNAAVVRLNAAYLNEKRQWEQRQFASKQESNAQLVRQFSTGASGAFPNQMQSQQQMMYGAQSNKQFNPYLVHQQSFGNGPMTPQQQMMMSSNNPQIMPMGRPGQYQQMHPTGASPGYPTGMQQNTNFQRMPLQQQRLGGHGSPLSSIPRYPTPGQQPSQQQMLGYFNGPSPASSLGSNPSSQIDPQLGAQITQRPGSVVTHGQLPFGSPGIPMNSGLGGNFQQQRTPSMPPSVTANNFDASSVANQSVFSVEGPASALHGQRSQLDQTKIDDVLALFQNCRSRIIAILMKDSIMDLHYDAVFDACPICSCNANIRSSELGLYVKVPEALNEVLRIQQRQQQDPTFKVDYWSGLSLGNSAVSCSCGFSAVRHRFLCSDGRGLFGDDVQEAGIVINQFKALGRGNERSNPKKRTLNELMDCLRFLSINRNLAICFKQAYYLGDFPSEDVLTKPSQIATSSQNTNYILSRVDIEELDVALRSVVQAARGNQSWSGQGNDGRLKKAPLFHPWGFQIASQVQEPKDQECLAVVREVQCVLERSMKEVRGIDQTSQTNIVEGPLTWRSLYRKAVKSAQEDDAYKPEQIPQILVSADRDPIATNPQLIHMWEKLSFSPFDQSKDVLYLAVVPDSNVIVEKCKVYLEELSTLYEKSRFGRHVKLSTKDTPRDGIIRLNMKSHSVVNAAAQGLGANNKFNEEDRKLHLKISAYCDQVLAELKATIANNESIFDRRAYYETLYRDSLQPNYTSLATSTDSNYMPPPVCPLIQSPPSILSTASGPASQPLNPMSNPTPTPTSLFSAPNTNQLPSPALSTGDNLMEPLRTPEVSAGTPGDQQQAQQLQQMPPSQHLSPEAIEKAIDEMLLEDHPLSLPHIIVIYLVNPFTFGSDTCSSRIARAAGLFLMKTFNSLLASMSSRRRPQIQFELINLQTLYDYSSFVADPLREERQYIDDMSRQDKASAYDCLRRVAFSVYSQTRLVIPEHVRSAVPSSMTRFGPASALSDIFDDLQRRDPPLYFKVPTMPFVLAPAEVLGVESANNKIRLLNPAERVLFVAYCLPSDDFLCAAVTDQHGHLADNVIINLHVDQPTSQLRYKNRSQIFDAIQRLWLYIQSVMVMETRNWRLVINRVGKIGHGEFKAWSQILSKNNLRSYNNSFKGRDRGDGLVSAGLDSASSASNCRTCQQTAGTQEIPIILSACLLSMEAECNLRLFSSSNSSVDLASGLTKSKGSTKNSGVAQAQLLDDPSITHIVAFPISPDIMDAQHGGNQPGNADDENIFDDLNFNELMQDDENIDALMGNTEFGDGGMRDTTIDHQPMSIGYSVSTAPANDLPDWFWNTCPNKKRELPVHLKSALHINSSNIHDELSIGQKTGNETFHPLDDTATDALLKHIMKVHNALSWLNVDVANGTRQSCLPVHMQTLFRLQRSIETLHS